MLRINREQESQLSADYTRTRLGDSGRFIQSPVSKSVSIIHAHVTASMPQGRLGSLKQNPPKKEKKRKEGSLAKKDTHPVYVGGFTNSIPAVSV